MIRQLPLGIQLRSGASFDSYLAGPNSQALAAVRACAAGSGEPFVHLWGREGTGRTHLLQAACRAAADSGRAAIYIPLEQTAEFTPEILDRLQRIDLVCLDDLQLVGGDAAWEQALFHLFNRLREHRTTLLTAADRAPARLPIALPDLRSRLGWGPCYRLHPLDDGQRQQWLIAAAAARGMQLPPETARYILLRMPRDMNRLQALVETLDRSSLAAQRPLTVPFVRSVLAGLGELPTRPDPDTA
ncbi:MAG TPA: DnaA regulatory inactivator Hda [Sedimenticola thiotaurini]|uniref:DnaA regulatory inactivator Hda n=1 Tax=Sedimenticola thiotaurini TaxID=1543721 RepID=A0A831RLL6_9GAMM|nr:DnaA regulatory inactivator Hda [Sedimenticola thiotaurini]